MQAENGVPVLLRMHFLQPFFLWALAALAVPVLIHLFNLQRTEKVLFANTRLLQNLVQQTSRARNLRHLLLLFFRMMAFICLILAFAQPVFSGEESGTLSGLSSVAVYLDNSTGMDVRDEGGSALERSIAYAASIPAMFLDKGWFRLGSNEIQTGKGWTSATGFRDQLLSIQKTQAQKKLSTVLAQQYSYFAMQGAQEKKQLFVLSDFQQGFLDDAAVPMLDSSVVHHFVPMVHTPVSNLWIDSAWIRTKEDNSGKTELFFSVNASGLQEKRTCRVQLYEGNNLQAGKQLDILPGKRFQTSISIRQNPAQRRLLRLELEDALISEDNNFFLVVQAPSALQVLRMGEKANPVLAKLFRSSPLFGFQECNLQNPDYEAIENCDLLILDKPQSLSESLSARIAGRFSTGRAVCLLPAHAAETGIRFSGIQAGEIPVLPEKSPFRAAGKILLPEAENSFYHNAFSNQGRNPALPETRAFYDLSNTGFPLLRFENGQVFLSREAQGAGHFFVFASDPTDPSQSFHRHPLMLATFFRMAQPGNRTSASQLFVSRNQDRIFLKTDSSLRPEEGPVELRNSGARIQAGSGQSGKQFFIQTDVSRLSEGFWEVWQNQKLLDVFAVNRDSRESEMSFLSERELRNLLPQKPWIRISSVTEEAKQEHLKAGMQQGWPAWKVLLLLSLLFLLAEVFLVRKMARLQKVAS